MPAEIKTSNIENPFVLLFINPTLMINCKKLEDTCYIDKYGDIYGCCPVWVIIPFGNILKDNYDKVESYEEKNHNTGNGCIDDADCSWRHNRLWCF